MDCPDTAEYSCSDATKYDSIVCDCGETKVMDMHHTLNECLYLDRAVLKLKQELRHVAHKHCKQDLDEIKANDIERILSYTMHPSLQGQSEGDFSKRVHGYGKAYSDFLSL